MTAQLAVCLLLVVAGVGVAYECALCVVIRAAGPGPRSMEILMSEVWLIATAGLLLAVFHDSEQRLFGAMWPAVWLLILAWVVRDVAAWTRLLLGRDPCAVVVIAGHVMRAVLAALAAVAVGAGWSLPAAAVTAGAVIGAAVVAAARSPATAGVVAGTLTVAAVLSNWSALVAEASGDSALALVVTFAAPVVAMVAAVQFAARRSGVFAPVENALPSVR